LIVPGYRYNNSVSYPLYCTCGVDPLGIDVHVPEAKVLPSDDRPAPAITGDDRNESTIWSCRNWYTIGGPLYRTGSIDPLGIDVVLYAVATVIFHLRRLL
jgi:hypothetical protein